jgi:hypothetical protein
MNSRIYLFIALMVLLSSCGKVNNNTSNTGNVIIVNEGGFNHGDASISIYDPSRKVVTNNVFKAQNGFSLGDVAQSLYMVGDTAYIVMNNSQNIVVADAAHNFKYLYSINISSSSPRFFLPVSNTKAYVTDLYANKIWIVDHKAGTVTGSISVTGWTEQLVSSGGKVYVSVKTAPAGPTVHKVLMIDPATDHVVSSIDLTSDPGSMALTDQNKLFVLTSVQVTPTVAASLNVIDLSSFSVSRKMDFDTAHTPSYLRYSGFTHRLLFADNGIYNMAHTDTVLPHTVSITSNSWNVYGLNADPANGDIYISDALDYQQASRIMRYSKDGTLIDAFNAGIITNGFSFR